MRDLDTIREMEAAAAVTYDARRLAAERTLYASGALPWNDARDLARAVLAAIDGAPRVPVVGADETAGARNQSARIVAAVRILHASGMLGLGTATDLARATVAAIDGAANAVMVVSLLSGRVSRGPERGGSVPPARRR